MPLRTELRTGDIVEILINPSRQPSRDWLNLVTTSRAKSKIRHWLNVQQTQQAVALGQRMLEKELRRYKLNPKRLYDGKPIADMLVAEGLARVEDLFARIGYGKLAVRQVLARVLSEEQLSIEPTEPGRLRRALDRILPSTSAGPIVVSGAGDLLAVLAKCCKPLPGEEIVGYITRGRGISVHSVDCPNVRNLLYNPERQIEVAWAKRAEGVYTVGLLIETEDQPGMLAKLTEAIARLDTNIREIDADTDHPGRGKIEVLLDVRDRAHLERIRQVLRALPGVLEVDRRMVGPAPRGVGPAS